MFIILLKACLHEGRGPQVHVGEVTHPPVPIISQNGHPTYHVNFDQIKMRYCMDRQVTSPKLVTSPTWVPNFHVNRP